MSYQKYQTDALVLRSYERGEADRVFALYTEEFGLVWARASAVRRESSRMRYALQPFAHSNISLVRGSAMWRVVGATARENVDSQNVSATKAFARISRLVERLVAGEERSDYLFGTLLEAHASLLRESKESHGSIELLCVARVLFTLGYISAEALGTALFSHTSYALPDLADAESSRDKLLLSVNKALSETQM